MLANENQKGDREYSGDDSSVPVVVARPPRRPPRAAAVHGRRADRRALGLTPSIRPARSSDHPAILAVVGAAFSPGGRDPAEEIAIVRRTWGWARAWALAAERADALIELVAEEAGAVVGHVQAALGTLEGRRVPVAGVAPVSVVPRHQRLGVGSALLSALVEEAEARAWAVLVVLGDPGYYGRFGFEPAAPLGITYAPVSPDDPHFQARRLAGYDPSLRGAFVYAWE